MHFRSNLNPPTFPMITYVIGDIFHSPAKVLVNTVNTKGVMGKGLAKDFKAIYPEMFTAYRDLCDRHKLDVGQLQLFRTPNKWILNFPTKRDWKHPSKPEYVEAGLKSFVQRYARHDITSIAFPQLGCGHGELDWANDVQPLMEHYLSKIPIPVFIHLYRKDVFPKEHADLAGTKQWLLSEPENLGFQEVWDDLLEIVRRASPVPSLGDGPSLKVKHVTLPEEGLEFAGQGHFFLEKDELLDFWQNFRSLGIIVVENLPPSLRDHAADLLALLAQLPYVRRVEIAKGRTPTEFVASLQLVPRPAQDDSLFSTATQVAFHV